MIHSVQLAENVKDMYFSKIQIYESADFDSYSAKHEGISKFKYHQSVKKALLTLLNEEVIPLRDDDYRIDDTALLNKS